MSQTKTMKMGGLVETIERCLRGRVLVPDSQQWAGWSDSSAVRRHGIYIGNLSPRGIAKRLRACWLMARGDKDEDAPAKPDYSDLFALAVKWNEFS